MHVITLSGLIRYVFDVKIKLIIIIIIIIIKCESGSSRFQPGEGPSRGLLRNCTTGCGPMDRFAALVKKDTICSGW